MTSDSESCRLSPRTVSVLQEALDSDRTGSTVLGVEAVLLICSHSPNAALVCLHRKKSIDYLIVSFKHTLQNAVLQTLGVIISFCYHSRHTCMGLTRLLTNTNICLFPHTMLACLQQARISHAFRRRKKPDGTLTWTFLPVLLVHPHRNRRSRLHQQDTINTMRQ